MIRYEANIDGSVSIGEPYTGFEEVAELEKVFDNLGWIHNLKRTGRGGYYFYEVEFNNNTFKLHIYLKRITFGGREARPYEKRVQFSAALERAGYFRESEEEMSLILGIYKNELFDDIVICAWDIDDWGSNIGRAFNCFVDVNAIALAYKNKFSQHTSAKGQIVCCFVQSKFEYYLDNIKHLHKEIISSEQNEITFNFEDVKGGYSDVIPRYSELFQLTIDVLKQHNGIANIHTIENEAAGLLKLSLTARRQIHNEVEGTRTELGYQLAWARFYLKKAGYLISHKRTVWELTSTGWNSIIDKETIITSATQREINEELTDVFNQNIISENDVESEQDLDLPSEAVIQEPFNPNDVDIRTRTMSLDLIIKRLNRDTINMETSFQRKANLWNLTKQSRLIESILVRFPLPAFYFDGSNDENWLVVDGLQRLSSLHNYVNLESFGLMNLEFLTQFNGKKFSELPSSLQRRIEEFEITSYIIAAGTPKILKFNVFKRINTGGLTLTSQEIRNALYQGPATKLLKDLANIRSFKIATSYSISDERLLDQEFVNRFLAFYLLGSEKYNSDLDSFLNKSLEGINQLLNNDLRNRIIDQFNKAMDASYLIFGNDAFRKRFKRNDKRKPINKALFETWSVLLAQLGSDDLDLLILKREYLKKAFSELLNSDEYFNMSITSATGDKSRVRKRFSEIEMIIKSVIRN